MEAMSATESPDAAELAKRLGAVEEQLAEIKRSGERLREQVSRVQEEQIEDLELALFIEDRLVHASGKRRPFEDVVRDLGFEQALEDER